MARHRTRAGGSHQGSERCEMKVRHLIGGSLLVVASAAAWTKPDEARFAECQKLLRAAQATHILDDLGIKGAEAMVMVGPGFFQLNYKAREGFSKAVSCLLVQGDAGMCANFDLRHWQSGKVVARFENCSYKP